MGETGCNPLHYCQVNTRTYRGRARILVGIGILTSYERMGMANLLCESGCDCDPVQMDGHTDDHFSQSGWFYHSGAIDGCFLRVWCKADACGCAIFAAPAELLVSRRAPLTVCFCLSSGSARELYY